MLISLAGMKLHKYLFSKSFFLIYLVSFLLSMGVFVDVKVLELIGNIQPTQFLLSNVWRVVILLVARNVYAIILTYILSDLTFKSYARLVSVRFMDTFKHRYGEFEKNELANYIANESLQFHLMIISPLCIMISTCIQLAVLSIGINMVLGSKILIVFFAVGLVYALYVLPSQYYLRHLGRKRREADEKRLNFLANATNSINDIRFGKFFEIAKAQHVDAPTHEIRRALRAKWANAESQKYILELSGLIGGGVWYLWAKPNSTQLLALAGLVFVLYRMAPMIIRFIVAYQSFSFGIASYRPPIRSGFKPNYNATIEDCVVHVKYKGLDLRLDCSDGGVIVIGGPSGGGKSTLLNCLGETFEKNGFAVGYVSQQPFVVKGSLKDNTFMNDLYDEGLSAQLGLADISSQRSTLTFDTVSGGEALRIALFRNLLVKPDVLLLDEPFSALDENNKINIIKILNSLSQELSIICVSHEVPEGLEVADVITIGK